MLRVRDEIRMTIAYYQTLYDSCIAYGMRMALRAEQRRLDMQKKIKQLESEVSELTRTLAEYKQGCERAEAQEAERRAAAAEDYRLRIEAQRKKNAELRAQLEALLSVPNTAPVPATLDVQ